MPSVYHRGRVYLWNGFWGFFFLPVGPGRTREKIIKEGNPLYSTLRHKAGYP